MMLYQQAANERKCPGKIQGKCFNYFGTFSKMVDTKIKKAGKHDIILFSRWTLSHDLVGDTCTGDKSFAEYIKNYFGKENK